MKKNFTKKALFVLTSLVLIAVIALTLCSCANNKETSTQATTSTATEKSVDATPIGTGATSFTFKCVMQDGSEKVYTVSTDKKTVGEALLENNLVAGEESEYGLYVKTVCDVKADYDTDGAYWAFYEGEDMAMNSADMTEIKAGSEYSFRYTK